MKTFKDRLLNSKKVSVWGIGYLGYTTILRLQENGFYSSIYDFNTERLDEIQNLKYPGKEQRNSWSKNGKIPSLNHEKLDIVKDNSLLFDNNVHIVSFPNTDQVGYTDLAKLFLQNRDKLNNSLIIFQSAGIPRTIDGQFDKIMQDNGLNIDIVTVFRSDWIIEDFFINNNKFE